MIREPSASYQISELWADLDRSSAAPYLLECFFLLVTIVHQQLSSGKCLLSGNNVSFASLIPRMDNSFFKISFVTWTNFPAAYMSSCSIY